MTTQPQGPRVLVVDDDAAVLRVHARALVAAGFRVETARNGAAAMCLLADMAFDVILSDIDMPGMDGLTLLARARERDADVPIVLITGYPAIESAQEAIEHGALRYLVKPVAPDALAKVVGDAACLHTIATAKRRALELAGGVDRLLGDRAGLEAGFARGLDTLFMVFQPIVSWSERRVFAFEALMRCREPSLPHPGVMLDAAERLKQTDDLGRCVRGRVIDAIETLDADALLFVNLHPNDLLDDDLFDPRSRFSAQARRVVLELTERSSLHDIPDISRRIAALRQLGFRIAIDDLGAGYAGLTSFALLQPEVVKLDMALVRDIHREPTKETLTRTMIAMCRELGITIIAEGIEVGEERDVVARLGCDLMQGYLFARPAEGFPQPVW